MNKKTECKPKGRCSNHRQCIYRLWFRRTEFNSKLRLLFINLASFPGRQLINSLTAQSANVSGKFKDHPTQN